MGAGREGGWYHRRPPDQPAPAFGQKLLTRAFVSGSLTNAAIVLHLVQDPAC